MASPLHSMRAKFHSEQSKITLKAPSTYKTFCRHQKTTLSTRTSPARVQRLATTIINLEPWRVPLPCVTEIATKVVKKPTKITKSSTLLEFETGLAHIPTPSAVITSFSTSTTSFSEIPTVLSNTSSEMAAETDLGSPQTTERRFFELPTATLLGVAISGSVAVNLFILVLWLLLRQKCSRDPDGLIVAKKELGHPVDDTVKEKPDRGDVIQMTRGGNSALLEARQISPVELDIHPPPSIHQPLPLPLSSFWSAASSSLALERARSHHNEDHLDAMEGQEQYTRSSLDKPMDGNSNSRVHTDSVRTVAISEHQQNGHGPDSRSDNEEGNRTRTIPSAFRHSRCESSTDPRSPRRLSVPLFMENFSSPRAGNYLPPQTESTINTSNEYETYDMNSRGVLQTRESPQRVVEHELGSSSAVASMASPGSLPSVSSDVLTPRRHWTFIDIHGPSARTASPQAFDSVLDRFSGTGSAQTLAFDMPGVSTGHFGSSTSQTPLSEPSGTDSFLYTGFDISAGSSMSNSRSVNPGCDTLHSFDYSIRTH